ncbi:MAG: DUF4870 domain-containing protein [Actinobacteria bacterium]|nr:MAG: DUF4870 domain-containing protein [Actinomycetota bacterium]
MTENPPTEPQQERPDTSDVSSESKVWAVAAHLLPLAGIYIIGALMVWLIKRDEDAFVEAHGREALNFQLSVLIYGLISALLIIVLIGFLMLIALAIFSFVMAIIAAVKAANGETYRYPMTMRMVKGR